MSVSEQVKGTVEKALQINLDSSIYGTIAEIGAGQEVARNFFIAGAAAGTIAKTMSAYDMQFSDAIYGEEENGRYVSMSRVKKMLNREYGLVIERLLEHRPENTKFFSFANSVVARGYKSNRDCHGWLGVKFQSDPMGEACEIILHVRMKDNSNVRQQQALGILGINLIYAAFYYTSHPEYLIESLLDNLSTRRIEIDNITFSGPKFKNVDNRLMSLHLVRSGLTHSVFFTAQGKPIQASDLLYKKNILVMRGSFRPYTNVHHDMVKCSRELYEKTNYSEKELIMLTEISMSHLIQFGDLDKTDFLGRVDTLCNLGYNVQISDFTHFHDLKCHLSQFTNEEISIMLGIKNIKEVLTPENYKALKGGIIEGLGILFSGKSRLFVYPKLLKNGVIRAVDEMVFDSDVKYLFEHFKVNGKILAIKNNDRALIDIFTRDVREALQKGDGEWTKKIPKPVYEVIKNQGLFGYSK